MDYVIKHSPEDFFVEEILGHEPDEGEGYTLCWMKKRNIDMFSALRIISERLKIQSKEIGYAGIKDKVAVTSQNITLPIKTKQSFIGKDEDNTEFADGITIRYIRDVKDRLNPGDLEGNRFNICVRSLTRERSFDDVKIPNFFGEQRFGKCNHVIGEMIIKRDFERAALLAMDSQKDGRLIREHLDKDEKDFIGALGRIGGNILVLFIHAYQSHLWNMILKEIISRRGLDQISDNDLIPIPGFSSGGGRFTEEYRDVLDKEGISERDFIIREIPKISSEGDNRKALMDISDLSYSFMQDDVFKDKLMCKISFSLGKGSYATTAIDFLFG